MNDYDKMFDKLPETVKELSHKIVVKQFVATMHAKRLEEATCLATKLRNELTEKLEEIESLKVELRDAINMNAKEIL